MEKTSVIEHLETGSELSVASRGSASVLRPAVAKMRDVILWWIPYSPVGNQIPGTRFITFKVPLKETFVDKLKPEDRLTVPILLNRVPALGLIIDLTQTVKYYDKNDVLDRGVDYVKIPVPGHVVPAQQYVDRFFEVIDYFLDSHRDDDTLIGVHCTHGVNRTGYMVSRYLIQRLGYTFDEAVEAIGTARGHPIERQNYLANLRNHTGAVQKRTTRGDIEEGKLKMRKKSVVKQTKKTSERPTMSGKERFGRMEDSYPPPREDLRSRSPPQVRDRAYRGENLGLERGGMMGRGGRMTPPGMRARMEPPIARGRSPPPHGMRGSAPPYRGGPPHRSPPYMRGGTPPQHFMRGRSSSPPPHHRSPPPPQHIRGRSPLQHLRGRSPPQSMRGRTPPPQIMRGRSPPPPHLMRGRSPPEHMRGRSPLQHMRGRASPPPQHMRGRSPPPPQHMRGRSPPSHLMRGRSPPPPQHMRGRSPPLPQHMRGRSPPPPQHMRGRSPPPPAHMRGRSPPPPAHMRGRSPLPPQHIRGRSSSPPQHMRGRSPPRHLRGRSPPPQVLRGRSPQHGPNFVQGHSQPMRRASPSQIRGNNAPHHSRGRSPPVMQAHVRSPTGLGRVRSSAQQRDRSPLQRHGAPDVTTRGRSPVPSGQLGERTPQYSYGRGRSPPTLRKQSSSQMSQDVVPRHPVSYNRRDGGPTVEGRSPNRAREVPPGVGSVQGSTRRVDPLAPPPASRRDIPRGRSPPSRREPVQVKMPHEETDYYLRGYEQHRASSGGDNRDFRQTSGRPSYNVDGSASFDFYSEQYGPQRRGRSASPRRRDEFYGTGRKESPPPREMKRRRKSPDVGREKIHRSPPPFSNGREQVGGGHRAEQWDRNLPGDGLDCREIINERRSMRDPFSEPDFDERKRSLIGRLPPKNVDLRESLEEEKRRKHGFAEPGFPGGGEYDGVEPKRLRRDLGGFQGQPELERREPFAEEVMGGLGSKLKDEEGFPEDEEQVRVRERFRQEFRGRRGRGKRVFDRLAFRGRRGMRD